LIPDPDATPDVLYNALGDTVNVAARLQEPAGPNGIAVGPETARQVECAFTLETSPSPPPSTHALEVRLREPRNYSRTPSPHRRPFPRPQPRAAQLVTGQGEAETVEPRPEWEDAVAEGFGLGVSYLGFRTDRRPFDDRRVRARDRSRSPRGPRTTRRARERRDRPPGLPGHSHRLALEYDLELARRLLRDGGYPGRSRPADSTPRRGLAAGKSRELVTQLAFLGVDVEAIGVSFVEMLDAIRGDARLWFWNYTPDYPDPDGVLATMLQLFPWFATDTEIDRLLTSARSTGD
jgi:hypothetical protein